MYLQDTTSYRSMMFRRSQIIGPTNQTSSTRWSLQWNRSRRTLSRDRPTGPQVRSSLVTPHVQRVLESDLFNPELEAGNRCVLRQTGEELQ